MARGDVEFLREGYEALARGDMQTFTALARERLAPDFEFHHVWGEELEVEHWPAGE